MSPGIVNIRLDLSENIAWIEDLTNGSSTSFGFNGLSDALDHIDYWLGMAEADN